MALAATVTSMLLWAFGFLRMSAGEPTGEASGAADAVELRLVPDLPLSPAILLLSPLLIMACTLVCARKPEVAAGFDRHLSISPLGAPYWRAERGAALARA